MQESHEPLRKSIPGQADSRHAPIVDVFRDADRSCDSGKCSTDARWIVVREKRWCKYFTGQLQHLHWRLIPGRAVATSEWHSIGFRYFAWPTTVGACHQLVIPYWCLFALTLVLPLCDSIRKWRRRRKSHGRRHDVTEEWPRTSDSPGS